MREAASDVCSIAHERAATKQAARQAAALPGFDDMAPPAALLALRICESYSTRLAPCIRGHLVRNAVHDGFSISLLNGCDRQPSKLRGFVPIRFTAPAFPRGCSGCAGGRSGARAPVWSDSDISFPVAGDA